MPACASTTTRPMTTGFRLFRDHARPRRPALLTRALSAVLVATAPAQAGLKIIRTPADGTGGTPPANLSGGGNLIAMFNQAADYWESVFSDPNQDWTVELEYQWGAFNNVGADKALSAQFTLGSAGGTLLRILSGSITFLNTGGTLWFADPDPASNAAFADVEPFVNSFPVTSAPEGIALNTGIWFVHPINSDAEDHVDLLTIAMHEIGHGLGLLNSSPGFVCPFQFEITDAASPRYAGLEAVTDMGEHLPSPALMKGKNDPGIRQFPSTLDILAEAQISAYNKPNWYPSLELIVTGLDPPGGVRNALLGKLRNSQARLKAGESRLTEHGRKNRLEASMKPIFRNTRWILPSVSVALLLRGAMALPCSAQGVEDRSLGPAVPARATTQSPLPAPTGPYEVGRTEFDWVDRSRPDSDSPSGQREIAVWLWYPASPKNGAEAAEWMPGKWGELLLPFYLRKHKSSGTTLSEVEARLKVCPICTLRTHAYPGAPMLHEKKRFPVLLFEPGFGMLPFFYTTLIEDLVSHGYIVAGTIPTYYTHYNVFSSGRVVDIFKSTHANASLPFWTGDMIFTLNQLEKLNTDPESPFHERLDFRRVGAFGHSFGGAASVQVAKDDPRVRAALDLDGTLVGDVVESGLLKPFLMFDHPHPGERNYHRDAVVFRDAQPAYRLTLAGAEHSFSGDFGLLPFIPTSAKKTKFGSIDPARALTLTKAYVEAFFGKYLEGKKSPLLNGPAPEYPEITFETNKK
jgi:hypothetical protein